MPLAPTPKGRAFTAASTAAGSIRSGGPSAPGGASVSNSTPLVFDGFYAAANTMTKAISGGGRARWRVGQNAPNRPGPARREGCADANRPPPCGEGDGRRSLATVPLCTCNCRAMVRGAIARRGNSAGSAPRAQLISSRVTSSSSAQEASAQERRAGPFAPVAGPWWLMWKR
jgi:hypothetical protein